MFGANAFGWPYFGQAYAGTTDGTAHTANVDDSVTLSDLLDRTVTSARSVADSVVLTDARTFAFGKLVADTTSLADNIAAVISKIVQINDAIVLADQWSRVLDYGRTQADGLILTDAALDSQGIRLGDVVLLSDSLTRVLGRQVSVADSVVIADSFARLATFVRTPTDQIGVLDEIVSIARALALSDQVNLLDDQDIVNAIITVLLGAVYTGRIGMGWTGGVGDIEHVAPLRGEQDTGHLAVVTAGELADVTTGIHEEDDQE